VKVLKSKNKIQGVQIKGKKSKTNTWVATQETLV